MNVLGFIEGRTREDIDGSNYYRCFLPLREVNRHDNDIDAQVINDAESEKIGARNLALLAEGKQVEDELLGRDVYVWARRAMLLRAFDAFADLIHKHGGVLVLDSDDDLTENYKPVSTHGETFKQMLRDADYVTTSTPALADEFAQYAQRPPVVLRNHLDVDWMAETASKARRLVEGFTVGFSGSPTHWGDWRLPAVPLSRIAREFDEVVPLLHGETPRYLNYIAKEGSLVKLGGVPFAAYPVLLAQFDIVLCAVDSRDPFNCGKSAAKALECMAVGTVPICSQFGPYQALTEAGAPAIIVSEESQDGWYEAIRDLVTDRGKWMALRDRGYEWVKANRDMPTVGYKHWEKFYRSIG